MDDDIVLQPFKSGIYHLALSQPDTEFIPVWLENINRVLPKGKLIPVPLLCHVNIGEPVVLQNGEDKASFLQRTRHAMLQLAALHELERQAMAATPAVSAAPAAPEGEQP